MLKSQFYAAAIVTFSENEAKVIQAEQSLIKILLDSKDLHAKDHESTHANIIYNTTKDLSEKLLINVSKDLLTSLLNDSVSP